MSSEQSHGAIATAQERVRAFVEHHGIACPPEARALDLVAEVGEVAKEVLKGSAYGQKPFAPPPDWGEELADTLFSLLCLANSTGVDLGAALDAALTKYKTRLATRGEPGSGR